jgi:outer membrane protein OmpA-like peptidoglycan-associated protein
MRPAFLVGFALLTAGCFGPGRHFAPASDPELEQLLGDYPSPGPNASNDFRDAKGAVVAFPSERAHFADEVVSYVVGVPAPVPEGQDPSTALGPPDYTPDKWQKPHAVSLGNGGAITLKWNHGALIDGDGPDLYIFEIGPNVEAMDVDVSADGAAWIPVGVARGGPCAVDIGPYVKPDDVFHYVRLRDVAFNGSESDAWPGADIDAVAVLGNARRLTLPSEVLFAFDSDVLAPGASVELDRLVTAVRAQADARVTIEGHTDDVGDGAYNQELSERRARAVATYLADRGVDRARIAVRGLGKSRPVASNDGDEGRRKNRRVEILIQGR